MQALDKVNDSNADSSALQLDEPEEKFQCWDKKWFAALVVFSWILIVGGIVLAVISNIQWDRCSKDNIDLKERFRRSEAQVEEMKDRVNKRKEELDKINVRVGNLTKEFEHHKKELERLEIEYKNLKEQLTKLSEVLKHIEEEYKKAKKENDDIRQNITEKEGKIRELNNSIEDIKRDIAATEKEITAFKAPTYTVGGLFALGLGYDIYAYIRLLSARSELARIEHFNKGYEAVAKGFENYEILKKKGKFQVNRKTCYNWPKNSSMKDCDNKRPTITTINTVDGYRFGAVFHEPWPTNQGEHKDPKAYTFSDTVGMEANIDVGGDNALISGGNLLQFGKTDIKVVKDGKSGTAVGCSYKVPPPYDNNTFYYNGTFYVKGIDIDVITIAPVP